MLGHTTGKSVHLNWGQRRTLHGTAKVLAWAAAVDTGVVTGWINVDAIAHDLSWMADATRARSRRHDLGVARRPAERSAVSRQQGRVLEGRRRLRPGMNATDYLRRNDTFNLTFNLPGYSSPPLSSGTIDVYPFAANLGFARAEARGRDRPPALRLLDGHAARDRQGAALFVRHHQRHGQP